MEFTNTERYYLAMALQALEIKYNNKSAEASQYKDGGGYAESNRCMKIAHEIKLLAKKIQE